MANKKIIIASLALGALGLAYHQGLFGGNKTGSPTINASQYEGKLLKTIPYNYRSSFVYGGKRYEITSDKAWSALNTIVGGLIPKTIELDINLVNQIPLGGYVSESGELINV